MISERTCNLYSVAEMIKVCSSYIVSEPILSSFIRLTGFRSAVFVNHSILDLVRFALFVSCCMMP